MKKLILTVALAATAWTLLAQSPRMLSRRQASDDLDTLYTWIRDIHPDMFAVCPKKTFERELRSVRESLPDSLSSVEFARRTIPLVTMLGDGHTFLGPGIEYRYSDMLFPFRVTIGEDSSIRVASDLRETDKPVATGTRILRIDGKQDRKVVGELMRYASGEQPRYRQKQIADAFEYYLLLHSSSGPYRIEFGDGNDTLNGEMCISAVRFVQAVRALPPERSPEPYVFRVLPGNIGLMEYNECQDMERFGRFVDSVFSEIRSRAIGELIIDVRQNGGGISDCSDLLLRYISPKPFLQFGNITVKVSDALRRMGNTQLNWVSCKNGYYRVNHKKNLMPLREPSERFRGRCYLLTSHMTFSSGSSFAWAFQYSGAGKVIGEETGGQLASFGDIQPFRLPYSGLPGTVSFKKFLLYGAKNSDMHGVIPDYEVPADEALDYTLKNLVGK